MDVELLFKIVNASVLPAWFLLVVLPHSFITRAIVHSYLYPFVLGVVYAAIIIPGMFSDGGGGMDSVAHLQIGFQNGLILVGAWIHYLIFDLFIGAWQVRDARKIGIPHWQIVPALVATLFLGPVGLMLYLLIRFVYRRNLSLT